MLTIFTTRSIVDVWKKPWYAYITCLWFRGSHRRCSVRKGVLRNFAEVTGKHLSQSLFFNKVAGLAWNLIEKETLEQVISCDFWEISKNIFFTEHIRMSASVWLYGKIMPIKCLLLVIKCYNLSIILIFPTFSKDIVFETHRS